MLVSWYFKIFISNYQNNKYRNCKELYKSFLDSFSYRYHLAEEGFEYILSSQQQKLSQSVTDKQQKIKGMAGSGKTITLLYRAVNAVKRTNKTVLILTYNLTLCNYLLEKLKTIPKDFDFTSVKGISNIAKAGLCDVKPISIGEASRISGVTGNDIALLLANIRK